MKKSLPDHSELVGSCSDLFEASPPENCNKIRRCKLTYLEDILRNKSSYCSQMLQMLNHSASLIINNSINTLHNDIAVFINFTK